MGGKLEALSSELVTELPHKPDGLLILDILYKCELELYLSNQLVHRPPAEAGVQLAKAVEIVVMMVSAAAATTVPCNKRYTCCLVQ